MFIFSEEHGYFYNKVCSHVFRRLELYGSSINSSTKFSISSLILALEAGLRGDLLPSYFLSSLPPGTGKTEAIASFVKVWKNEGFVPDSSILICFNTKDEIRSVIKILDIDDADYACCTRDDELNAFGRGMDDARNARILFTTHQMIISRTKTHRFGSVKDFFYKEGARPLRIWDESMILSAPITVRWAAMVSLSDAVRYTHKPLADILHRLIDQGNAVADGVVRIPKGIKDAADGLAKATRLQGGVLTGDQQSTLDGLLALEGRSAWQVAGSYGDRALVGSSKPLPKDFAPAIITDASGAVRGTYRALERGAGGLIRLPAFANDYRKVRIHLWSRSAGQKAFGIPAHRDTIFRTIAKLIGSKPGEQWLVIGSKTLGGVDTKVELHSYLPSDTKVGFLNWGRHHGTNLYKNTKNIIVIGTYGYPKESYTALEIAASGIGVEELDAFRWEQMREAEIAHNMLQGMLRGNARNSDDGIARECDIYLIASKNPDMKRILATVFPNAVFDEWGVNRKDGLTGQSGKVLDHLKALFADSSTDKVRKKAVREAVGIADAQGLTNVLARDEVRSALEEAGIAVKLQHFERSSG